MDEYLTAEQVRARVVQPTAALLGPDGLILPLGDRTTIGRDPKRCELAILHASVSAVHAVIERAGDVWTIRDLGSTNGTSVDGGPAPRPLAAHARVRVGAVELTFWPAAVDDPPRRRRRTTMPGLPAWLCGLHLTPREQRLIEILDQRRRDVGDAELAYVPSAEIAAVLGFRSIDADSDNVRELVLRVRRKLRAVGAGDMIQSRRGAGYRLDAGDLAQPAVRAA